MDGLAIRGLLLVLAAVSAGCERAEEEAGSSVTVRLPPARPAAPEPGFTAALADHSEPETPAS